MCAATAGLLLGSMTSTPDTPPPHSTEADAEHAPTVLDDHLTVTFAADELPPLEPGDHVDLYAPGVAGDAELVARNALVLDVTSPTDMSAGRLTVATRRADVPSIAAGLARGAVVVAGRPDR